jgi:DNA-binding response OmpR family regulator
MTSEINKKEKILLVEDEESLAIGLEYNFSEEGYNIFIAKDGREAIELFESQDFDLIILDVMLPFLDGFEITKYIREKSPRIPILILTAKVSSQDRIKGLEIGADDYLTKPFHLQELLLRVKGMLKRKDWYNGAPYDQLIYKFGQNEIDFKTFNCKTAKGRIRLTQNEIMVLKYLIDNKGKIVSRFELLENVWNINPEIETRTVDNFISRLRKYFEPNPSKPIYFKSVRGAGYIFNDQSEE